MKTITFKELIELIEKNEQPEVIWTSIHKFEWDEITENYYSRDDKGLLVYHTLGELVVEQIQIPTKPLLTDKEKAYLKAVIEPFKDEIEYIVKRDIGGYEMEHLVICHYENKLIFSTFERNYYKGLVQNKHYSLKELGLE